MLGAAIHLARRMIGIDQVDRMAANLVNTAVEAAQDMLRPVERFQRGAAYAPPAAIHVVGEERDKAVQIARIDSKRIAYGQLLDRQLRLYAFDSSQQIGIDAHVVLFAPTVTLPAVRARISSA